VALVHLAARLRAGGFVLLDTQFVTDHLTRLGAVEIDKADYLGQLAGALSRTGDFLALPAQTPGALAMQDSSQAS
jgi:leucyl/phenylalanyl-tRNA--protein transferase